MNGSTPDQARGFFVRLFDFSFKYVVAPSVIRVIYVISVVFLALQYLGVVGSAFHVSGGAGVLALVFYPIVIFLELLWIRVILELFMAIFRIASNTEVAAVPGAGLLAAATPGVTSTAAPGGSPLPPPPSPAWTPAAPTPVPQTPPVAAPPGSWCTSCGTALGATDRFCPSCGTVQPG